MSTASSSSSSTPTMAKTLEVCNRWRVRGNEAYEKGNLSRAEECYTMGVKSVSYNEKSGCCLEPLVLCYSNRAAARMACGRIRDALGDCLEAAALDPNFLKVQVRAANCHLLLGEVEDAVHYFNKCRESGGKVCLDRKVILQAADGLQKAKKVTECTNQCVEIFQQRTSDAATNALAIIDEVLSISYHSEKLLEMKGQALLMLQKYEEVIQLCEQTLGFAEKNCPRVGAGNNLPNANGSQYKKQPSVRLWRWNLMAKSYFYLGRLEVALNLLSKQEKLISTEECLSNDRVSSTRFPVAILQLLSYENKGKEAFQAGRHTEAIKHYTAAISISPKSRPFTAICFCERAAALQALGQIPDAIADCNLAIALDGNCLKAMRQRANLHETIGNYEEATNDLKRFISILEKQLQEKVQQPPDGATGSNIEELRSARSHLSLVAEKAKQGDSLDLHLILGIKASDGTEEIKTAYQKAVLRHHPDKVASKVLAESGGDKQLWNEIVDEIRNSTNGLYRMIAKAKKVLLKPTKI